jgi:hypothetical protein
MWLVVGGVALLAAVVAGGVLWAASSSEPSRAEYTRTVVDARDRVDAALVRITKSPSPQELIDRLDEAADQADIAADEVQGAGTPSGLGDVGGRLVDTLRRFAGELEGTARTLEDPQFGDAASNVTSLSFEQWIELNAVLADLKDAGIAVEQLPRH